MKITGATLVLKTTRLIEETEVTSTGQELLEKDFGSLKKAPKIFKDDCRIDWSRSAKDIFNHIRGLSPHPAAFTTLISPGGEEFMIKVFRSEYSFTGAAATPPLMETDGRSHIHVRVCDGTVSLSQLQLAGRNKLDVISFLRGFHIGNGWKIR